MRRSSRAMLPLFPSLAAAFLGACASGGGSGAGAPSRPATSDQAYAGPAVAIDSATGPNHLIVLTAPTPGWSFSFDQVGPTDGDIYVTVRPPDPSLLYAAMIVEQKLDSTVPSGKPARVYVRMLEFGEKAGSQAYRLAKETAR